MVAGEMSGDNLGAGLIRALRQHHPNVIAEGIGGPNMIAEGFNSMANIDELAMMGYVEPLLNLPRLLRLRKNVFQHFVDKPPDIFIGIDYAYFNNTLESKLKNAGIVTAHYVSPQLWASRPKRIHSLKKSVDLMLCLFPFEVDLYHQHQMQAEFIGHPLADVFPMETDKTAARTQLNLPQDCPLVALLPGSRGNEVKYLLHHFIDAANYCLQKNKNIQFILPAANSKRLAQINAQLHNMNMPITVIEGQSHTAMAAADVVLMASGTTTLEAMLLKKPMVVSYQVSKLNYAIMSRLLNSDFVSLPNVLAGKSLVPEILQDNVNGQALGEAVMRYFDEPEQVELLQKEFTAQHNLLRQNASQKAAQAILRTIKQ